MRLSAESSFLILRQTSSFLCSVTVLKIVMRKTNTAFNLSGSEESSLVENAHFINSGKINAKLSTAQTHLSIAACLPFLLLLLSLLHLGAFSPFSSKASGERQQESVQVSSRIRRQNIRQRWHRVLNHVVRPHERKRERERGRNPEERARRRKLNCTWGANSIRE